MSTMEPLSALEEQVSDAIRRGGDELVALASELIAYDTTARNPGDPAREEAALQASLAKRLSTAGAAIDLWEPETTPADSRFLPPRLDFSGRPQLAATFAGAGGGRSLMLNGHIDAVDAGDTALWTSPPLRPEVRDGRLYGRGATDMKGGIASCVFASEMLARLGVRLAGDLIVSTNTDEESSGAGGYALVERGLRADACLVAEPTGFDAWVSCRGTVTPTIIVEGRAGHAELRQPHWHEGGAVNAIEKMGIVLDAIRSLRDEWRDRPDQKHRFLPPGDIVPTIIRGGNWMVTYPERCELVVDISYLPGNVDADGTGRAVEREVEAWIAAAAAADPWLAEHPPRFEWTVDVVPAEIPPDHPAVTMALGLGAQLGRPGRISGLDSWHDAATFGRLGGTPSFSYGPGGMMTAHAVDEYVPVDDLVDLAVAAALLAMRWCGVVE
ncbi:MAG: ArgE/DapE family deacylase [Actinobacteria bacterium]|nr:ArgE/DapE family deacylase [Actinomycetota bacterium]